MWERNMWPKIVENLHESTIVYCCGQKTLFDDINMRTSSDSMPNATAYLCSQRGGQRNPSEGENDDKWELETKEK